MVTSSLRTHHRRGFRGLESMQDPPALCSSHTSHTPETAREQKPATGLMAQVTRMCKPPKRGGEVRGRRGAGREGREDWVLQQGSRAWRGARLGSGGAMALRRRRVIRFKDGEMSPRETPQREMSRGLGGSRWAPGSWAGCGVRSLGRAGQEASFLPRLVG